MRTRPYPGALPATPNSTTTSELLADRDDTDAVSAIVTTYTRDTTDDQIVVVDGYGAVVRVDRGHLTLTDGLGPWRRTRRYAKATHGLRRLVVLAHAGTLSIDSLRWTHQLGIEVAVIDADANVLFTSVPTGTRDARLRRAQALAAGTPLGHAIARELLEPKLRSGARLLRSRFDQPHAAARVDDLADAMRDTATVEELRALEAEAASITWSCWTGRADTAPMFAVRDRARIPAHWKAFESRRSVLASANGNRRAERPANAICNYLTGLAEVEATIAAQAVGLDVEFGFVHADTRGRNSFALDLLEVARPAIEAHVLDLLADRTFKRSDFTELEDGHCRLLAPLTHELAQTMPRWAKIIGPYAEQVAHLLGEHLDGSFTRTTPITRRNQRIAQAKVKARKAASGAPSTRRQRPTDKPEPPAASCVSCGAPVEQKRHVRCPACWATQPSQSEKTRRERGKVIAARRAELERWRSDHPDARTDPEAFRRDILPGLATVKLAEIQSAIGCAKSTASMIRSGSHTPALRHWDALGGLVESKARAIPATSAES